MHPIDWIILLLFPLALLLAALSTRAYARSVSGFLAANRCAGRYLTDRRQAPSCRDSG